MNSEFALFLFTTLVGAAAGAYVARAVFPLPKDRKAPWLFPVCALVLLGISGVALLLHLGHPERAILAFSNLGAGIAQEGVTTMVFGVLVLVDCIFCFAKKDSPRWLVVVTALAGVVAILAMGVCYAAFVGEPAWASPLSIPFFVLGSISMGAGLYLAFKNDALSEKSFNACFLAAQVLAAVAIIAECVHFAGAGFGTIGLIAGLVVGPVASAALAIVGKKPGKQTLAWVACALAIVGIVIARYAFYAASLF